MIMASRLVYGMSVKGVVPPIFSRVHAGRHTPIAAIIFTTGLAMVLATLGDLSQLAGTTTTLLLFVFHRSTSPCSCCGATRSRTSISSRRA